MRDVSEGLHFEGDTLAATEDMLSRLYAGTQIRSHGAPSSARITRSSLGEITHDEIDFGYALDYQAGVWGRVCISRVHSGQIKVQPHGTPSDVFTQGEVAVYGAPESSHSGQVRHAAFDLTMFDLDQLDRVAATGGNHGTRPVRLTSHRPVSVTAGRRLGALIDYLRDHVLVEPAARRSPLVSSAAIQGLATAVLMTIPNTAVWEATAVDRRDSRPDVVRRAVAFIDNNAHTGIALADIARAVNVSPRAVQYMFRRHLDTSPMEYLRRVRLDHAHHDLIAAAESTSTVKAIAIKWGFTNYTTFVTRYRKTYGCSPHKTFLER